MLLSSWSLELDFIVLVQDRSFVYPWIGTTDLGVRMPCDKFISRSLTCSSLGEKLVYTKEGYIKWIISVNHLV